MDPGEKILFYVAYVYPGKFPIEFFTQLHINSKISTCQSKFVYVIHKLIYFCGKVATLARTCFHHKYFATGGDPLWHRQDGQPKPMSPLSPHLKVECRRSSLRGRP